MVLAAPAWLLLLVPWAGLVVLALRAYRPRVYVPFLDLWPREEVKPEQRRGWRPPPMALVLLLLALLAVIGAMARPQWVSGEARLRACTVVVDRGVTMLAGGRLAEAGGRAIEALAPVLAEDAEVRVIDQEGRARVLGRGQLSVAALGGATALETRGAVEAVLWRALSEGDGPVVLVSDMEVGEDERLVVVRPDGAVDNVGIVAAASAREVLLTLRNDSDRPAVVCTTSDGARHEVRLPGRGETGQVRLPAPAGLFRVALEVEDDLADDNVRWLVGGGVARALVLEGTLPEVVRRFAAAYQLARPASEISPGVTISAGDVGARRSIQVAGGETSLAPRAPDVLPDHPLLREVRLPVRARASEGALPAGRWEVLWQAGERVLLAVDDGARRVFVGFAPEGEADTAEYLVLLTNAVEFCAGGVFAEAAPGTLEEGWRRVEGEEGSGELGTRAGLYARGESYRAVHVTAPVLRTFAAEDVGQLGARLRQFAEESGRKAMAPWLLLAATALVVAAIACVGRGR